jgi:glyceraldehyde-3-phosphate dehydrogenase (NAD(P))
MIRVAVNGYGTIGKRVADAVATQPDMEVAGVAKTRPNYEARGAVDRGYPLYAAVEERADRFAEAGIELSGLVDELVADADVVVDATPSGVGEANLERYAEHGVPALLQGGEADAVVDTSFTARANYDAADGADAVRVVSCNTTGLARLLAPLREAYGVEKVRATLIRRGGDPSQSGRGPINDVLPNPVSLPSHHGPDVKTVFPDLAIDTLAVKVPVTLMHVHSVNVTLEAEPETEAVRELLGEEDRLFLFDSDVGIDGAGALKEFALDAGRPRGDLWENGVWADSVSVVGRDLYLFQAIHQESDVVPENVDAIRAVLGEADAASSMATTDEALGVGEL